MSLQVRGVSKSFGTIDVLDDVSIDVDRGSRLAIVGASGSGKSTLLRIIAGFERPIGGEVWLDERILTGPSIQVGAHRRGIGYVAQDGALFPHLTVRKNIAFGLPRGPGREERVREVIDLTSLDSALLDRYPHQLSGGQQQRVALARALAPDPRVILLDEPFSALDTGLRAHTREAMIRALERSAVTTILVTHDQEEALSFGQQLAVIAAGRLVQAGRPSKVFDAPVSGTVAEFLGAALFLPVVIDEDARAVSALGSLQVRHDLSHGSRRVRAMLRPAQLNVSGPAKDGNATVVSVVQGGSTAVVRLEIGDAGGLVLEHGVPLHVADRLRPGAAVHLGVDGGVVLYPDATLPDPAR